MLRVHAAMSLSRKKRRSRDTRGDAEGSGGCDTAEARRPEGSTRRVSVPRPTRGVRADHRRTVCRAVRDEVVENGCADKEEAGQRGQLGLRTDAHAARNAAARGSGRRGRLSRAPRGPAGGRRGPEGGATGTPAAAQPRATPRLRRFHSRLKKRGKPKPLMLLS